MAQRWEHSPPTNVAWVQIPPLTHMWVEFVVGSLLCSERFFSGYSGFPLSSKTNISRNSSSTRKHVDEEPLSGCVTSKSLCIYLFNYYYFKLYWISRITTTSGPCLRKCGTYSGAALIRINTVLKLLRLFSLSLLFLEICWLNFLFFFAQQMHEGIGRAEIADPWGKITRINYMVQIFYSQCFNKIDLEEERADMVQLIAEIRSCFFPKLLSLQGKVLFARPTFEGLAKWV